MTSKFTHAPRRLPINGPLGEYNDCLAIVSDQIRIMKKNNANLEWLNEVQRLINLARQNAMDSNPYNENQEYYDQD